MLPADATVIVAELLRDDRRVMLFGAPGSWVGRQVALVHRGNCLAIGEVAGLDANFLRLRGSATASDVDTLLVRDALRGTAGLARNAHTLFLEAVFTEVDVVHAHTHGHLTARACGEIASAAGVSRLVPFHLSRRYLDDPQQVFDELEVACGCVALPGKQLLPATAEASGHVEFAVE